MSFKERAALTSIDQSFEPRYYQLEAVQSAFDYFYAGNNGHPLIVIPTGGGKSPILGMFCKRVLSNWPDQKIVILSHVDTILEQDYFAVRKFLPENQVGVFSAGVGLKQRRSVTIAGIQSIYKMAQLFASTTIILIDEAHLVPPGNEGMYRTFLSHFTCPVIGLTATHFRLKSGYLHHGEGRLFTDIAYEIDVETLINENYLCQLIPKCPDEHIDVDGVGTQGGEFITRELVERANREGLTEAIVQDLARYKELYKHWLIFTIDIKHCEDMTELLRIIGIDAVRVHSKMPKGERTRVKAEFNAGRHQALVSVETLTTGFDSPHVDLIGLCRPTKSPVLHIQMIGRGLRPHDDKNHCLILDYAGNVERLGPINDVHVAKRRKKGGGPPITKTCPDCQTIHPGATRICFVCGHAFEFKEKLETKSGGKEVVKKKKEPQPPEWHTVTNVSYQEYTSNAGNQLLMVTYRCGLRAFFEYKSFDPGTRAYYHTRHWWAARAMIDYSFEPKSPGEAVIRAQAGELKMPSHILVSEQGKYPDILQFNFL